MGQSRSAIGTTCEITNAEPEKAKPSLLQCYRDNAESCCNSEADDYIKQKYEEMFTASCKRKFPHLEIYWCFACNRNQFKFTDVVKNVAGVVTSRKIKLCKSFAEKIWDSDVLGSLDKATTGYDKCGIKVGGNTEHNPYKLPSEKWTNFAGFATALPPPFFSAYTIEVDAGDDPNLCFAGSKYWAVGLIGIALVFAISFMQ